jgi:hypothetical protein
MKNKNKLEVSPDLGPMARVPLPKSLHEVDGLLRTVATQIEACVVARGWASAPDLIDSTNISLRLLMGISIDWDPRARRRCRIVRIHLGSAPLHILLSEDGLAAIAYSDAPLPEFLSHISEQGIAMWDVEVVG